MTTSAPTSTRAKQLTGTAKSLLKNVIRHTDTHNRLKEEGDMWQQFYRTKKRRSSDERSPSGERERRVKSSNKLRRHSPWRSRDKKDRSPNERERSRKDRSPDNRERSRSEVSPHGDLDVQRSFLYDDREDMSRDWRYRGRQHAHMDDRGSQRASTYWMRQLDKAEVADSDRWGHSGFKELYPKDFDSGRSRSRSSSRSNESRSKSRRRKSKKSKRSRKKKKSRLNDESDESLERNRQTKLKIKKEIKKNKKKKRKLRGKKSLARSYSGSDSRTDGDTESESSNGGKRSWRNGNDNQPREEEGPQRKKKRRY